MGSQASCEGSIWDRFSKERLVDLNGIDQMIPRWCLDTAAVVLPRSVLLANAKRGIKNEINDKDDEPRSPPLDISTHLTRPFLMVLGALSIPMANVHVNAPETADLDILVLETVSDQHLV